MNAISIFNQNRHTAKFCTRLTTGALGLEGDLNAHFSISYQSQLFIPVQYIYIHTYTNKFETKFITMLHSQTASLCNLFKGIYRAQPFRRYPLRHEQRIERCHREKGSCQGTHCRASAAAEGGEKCEGQGEPDDSGAGEDGS